MKNIGFVFSGQGSQFAGMGKDFYDEFPIAKKIFDEADSVLGFSISDICFNDAEKLKLTSYAQPAIFTTTVAILEVLKEKGFNSNCVCGLSLGEYAALYESGMFTFSELVSLVHKRGKIMESVVPKGKGGMAAVIGIEKSKLEAICNDSDKILEIANYNSPNQLVVGGEIDAVLAAQEKCIEAGAKRYIMLDVAGPFHTSMLNEAGVLLEKEMTDLVVKDFNKEIIMNVTGNVLTNKDDVKALMVKQVCNSVMFEDSVRVMIDKGVDTFVEIGPGKVLTSFIRKISKEVTTTNIQDVTSLSKTLEKLVK